MMRILIALALLAAANAFALEDTPEARSEQADRYLAVTPPKDLFKDMAEQVSKSIPADKREAFTNALTKDLDTDALTRAVKGAMVKDFSADELKALADFYGSPIGRSAMKKFGTYMADVMPAIQNELLKAIAKANQVQAPAPSK